MRVQLANWAWILLGFTATIWVWEWAVQVGVLPNVVFSAPSEIFNIVIAHREKLSDAHLFQNLYYSLRRIMIGWSIAMGVGVLCGLTIGRVLFLRSSISPVLEFARAVPPVLVFPMFLILGSYGEWSYLGTVLFGCIPVIVVVVAQAIGTLSSDRMDVLKVFNVGENKRLQAIAGEALPSVFLAARLTFALSIVIVTVTEMVVTPQDGFGIGAFCRDSLTAFQQPAYFIGIILIGLIGVTGNALLMLMQRVMTGTEARPNF